MKSSESSTKYRFDSLCSLRTGAFRNSIRPIPATKSTHNISPKSRTYFSFSFAVTATKVLMVCLICSGKSLQTSMISASSESVWLLILGVFAKSVPDSGHLLTGLELQVMLESLFTDLCSAPLGVLDAICPDSRLLAYCRKLLQNRDYYRADKRDHY